MAKLNTPCIMTIFGGTGDLSHRKLIPALYCLIADNYLPDNFVVVGIGRKAKTHKEYQADLLTSLRKYSRQQIKEDSLVNLASRIFYYQLEITESNEYSELNNYLLTLDKVYNTLGNRLFYFSVAPKYFETIAQNLHEHNMISNISNWQRILIEKPFGQDLETARYLNSSLNKIVTEKNIFRIDHYLGKEMLQNLMVIRFGNSVFESVWNNSNIENIQITAHETVGVENRSEYYDSSGAMKDMVQNHLLQLLSLLTMDAPEKLTSEAIKTEKLKILRSLSNISSEEISSNIIRAQYSSGEISNNSVCSYLEEKGIPPTSMTETYVCMKLTLDHPKWSNIPIYLRTGKRMSEKGTYIVIEFKRNLDKIYFNEYKGLQPNLLKIAVNPNEGVSFEFNTKTPGSINEISNVKMDFCQNCTIDVNSPEAYERIIIDSLRNDNTLFTSWDEIEAAWQFADKIIDHWKNSKSKLYYYKSGTLGPEETNELLNKNNHKWWNT